MDRAVLQGAEQKEIRQIPRRDQPPVNQAKAPRRRPAGGAIDRGQGRAQGDGAAHQVVQVALFVDSQRIAIVGAEARKGEVNWLISGTRAARSFEAEPAPSQRI
jgi:hypothetical protein